MTNRITGAVLEKAEVEAELDFQIGTHDDTSC